MAGRGLRVALLGATGAVGSEILAVLDERRFPVTELRAFSSDASAGSEIEFRGESVLVGGLAEGVLRGCDLVIAAAPGVLERMLDEVREIDARVVDLSGAFELDPAVPLWLPGLSPLPGAPGLRWIGIPRGVVAGLAAALTPLAREVELLRATVTTLEPAVGAGRNAVAELTDHIAETLNQMSGEVPESQIFPRSLAFDCLPQVGSIEESGQTDEERRLVEVTRRLVGRPELRVDVTRVRVPVFGGSLACVHAEVADAVSAEALREGWAKQPGVELVDDGLPTPRTAVGRDEVRVGRVRAGSGTVVFVVALDNLRRGAALAAVEAAEALCASD